MPTPRLSPTRRSTASRLQADAASLNPKPESPNLGSMSAGAGFIPTTPSHQTLRDSHAAWDRAQFDRKPAETPHPSTRATPTFGMLESQFRRNTAQRDRQHYKRRLYGHLHAILGTTTARQQALTSSREERPALTGLRTATRILPDGPRRVTDDAQSLRSIWQLS